MGFKEYIKHILKILYPFVIATVTFFTGVKYSILVSEVFTNSFLDPIKTYEKDKGKPFQPISTTHSTELTTNSPLIKTPQVESEDARAGIILPKQEQGVNDQGVSAGQTGEQNLNENTQVQNTQSDNQNLQNNVQIPRQPMLPSLQPANGPDNLTPHLQQNQDLNRVSNSGVRQNSQNNQPLKLINNQVQQVLSRIPNQSQPSVQQNLQQNPVVTQNTPPQTVDPSHVNNIQDRTATNNTLRVRQQNNQTPIATVPLQPNLPPPSTSTSNIPLTTEPSSQDSRVSIVENAPSANIRVNSKRKYKKYGKYKKHKKHRHRSYKKAD